MSMLDQNTTKKRRDFSMSEFDLGNNKGYVVEAIRDNAVYAMKANGHLLGLYYLVA